MWEYQFVEDMRTWKQWESEHAQQVTASINALRAMRGFTIKQLRDRLAHFGWDVSQATLSGILSGNKRSSFSIAEIFAFARAFNVSPTYIMLGLPHATAMPAGRLFDDERSNVSVGGWLLNEVHLRAHPDDDLARASQSPEYFTEALARQGLSDLERHAAAMRMIQWQAALLVVADEYPRGALDGLAPERVLNRDYLWDAINMLSSARRYQRDLISDDGSESFSITFPPIEGWLAFIDADSVMQVMDPTIDQLRSLTNPNEIQRARDFYRNILDAKVDNDGAPSNSDQ